MFLLLHIPVANIEREFIDIETVSGMVFSHIS